ncbi:MAG: PAS domain S-box protein [Armatimonadetes bacterium]|nr:PAS domain S-box protein [Armatimonadota bacterium]
METEERAEQEQRATQAIAELLEQRWRHFADLLSQELSRGGFERLARWTRGMAALDQPPWALRLLVGLLREEPTEELLDTLARRLRAAGVRPESLEDLAAAAGRVIVRLFSEQGLDEPDLLATAVGHVSRASAQLLCALQQTVMREWETAAQRLRLVYESMGEAILLVDAATARILDANPAAERLANYTRTQLRWMCLADLLPEAAQVRWPELIERSDHEPPMSFECALMARGGERPIVRVTAGKFTYQGRHLVHLTVADITDQILLTQRLAELTGTLRTKLEEQMHQLDEQRHFLASILDAVPLRLLVLDKDLRVMHANPAYCRQRGVEPDEVIGKPLREVFPVELMEDAGLEAAIRGTLASGEPVRWSGYRTATPDHPERIVDIRLDPCQGPGGEHFVLLTIEDVTLREQQLYERTLLQQVMSVMLETGDDVPRLLYAILTAMTAGGTCGLGFNRAFLLLADEEEGVLRGEMGVGPRSAEEAYCIWSQVADRYKSLEDFMREYDESPPPPGGPLGELARRMVFSLRDVEHLPMLAVTEGRAVRVTHAISDPRVPSELYQFLGVEEFVVAPMMTRDKIIGVALADNFVTGQPIGEDDVNLLTSLANHVALALDLARARERERQRAEELRQAYEELDRTQQELVRSKQLAAIGEVTAIVAHEIRNPLSTIGGFARHLLRSPGDKERVQRNARIILDEVQRLEGILNDLLEFSKPRELHREPTDLVALAEELADMMRTSPFAAGVEVRVEREGDIPLVLVDQLQFRQVLNNLMRNAVEAMPDGGTMTLRIRRQGDAVAVDVADTGVGIPEDRLAKIFDAFVTSKPAGTGLGLALSRAIVRQHGAELTVKSKPAEGTVFTVLFPPEACVTEAEAQQTQAEQGPQDSDQQELQEAS